MEGPLLHIPDNDHDNSQPTLSAENYPMLDQGKMKYFAVITPITVEINYLPKTLASYFQCNHSLTDVLQQITRTSIKHPSGKLSK